MTNKGLIHLYTGDGKGKTSAAVGLAVRAVGADMKVLFVQFLKGGDSGELAPLRQLDVQTLCCEGPVKFVFQMDNAEKEQYHVRQANLLQQAAAWCTQKEIDVLVLDEVLGALETGMVDEEEVCRFLDQKPEGLEVVLTGREAPASLRERAQYISEIACVAHPFAQGMPARKGIEW